MNLSLCTFNRGKVTPIHTIYDAVCKDTQAVYLEFRHIAASRKVPDWEIGYAIGQATVAWMAGQRDPNGTLECSLPVTRKFCFLVTGA